MKIFIDDLQEDLAALSAKIEKKLKKQAALKK
jgi:hypothetical protein